MTLREAAKLVNKTEKTISRWKSDGCKLNEESLLLWSEKMDLRARGKSKTRWLHREDQADDVRLRAASLAKLLKNAPEGHFQELPCPASYEIQKAACDALDALAGVWKQRVEELETIGHAHSLEMADDEYRRILTAAGSIRLLLSGYEE